MWTDLWTNSQNGSGEIQVVGQDIPVIYSTFYLKSGVRARLVDRSGSLVILEVDRSRSDWIEWSEVKSRIASTP